ncbi:hypothetical protein [Petrocella sp. FN5]|uniref:hypothetical protein n=1 Tax=Petrocella sp. FN5 TaxID=3032002 RepID=UPI0023DBBD72|nr:hypothetical protein [Petrocella sp. FN5]MDF1617291.1 hypothetical protein [Petrocella sp. FN5]
MIESTIEIECVLVDKVWYVAEINDELADVAMSGFISAYRELAKVFEETNAVGYESDLSTQLQNKIAEDEESELTINDYLWIIDNFVTVELWNNTFCQIDYYLERGNGATGGNIDIDL